MYRNLTEPHPGAGDRVQEINNRHQAERGSDQRAGNESSGNARAPGARGSIPGRALSPPKPVTEQSPPSGVQLLRCSCTSCPGLGRVWAGGGSRGSIHTFPLLKWGLFSPRPSGLCRLRVESPQEHFSPRARSLWPASLE